MLAPYFYLLWSLSFTMEKLYSTRRNFIKNNLIAGACFTILPSAVISGLGKKAPSDKLNIAGIGIGGKGRWNLKAMSSENIIGLCDVDWKYARPVFEEYPKAKQYVDWRRMFDELEDSMDGVMIATADHTHAVIAATALIMNKHVYCQKPLTHSIYESRLLAHLAKKHSVATQMGNQGNSGHGVRQVCEWIWNGEIGEIKTAHAWTNRPLWPQGQEQPGQVMPVPDTLDWELFLGPAPYRPYHETYTPWNWRGWWDFGTGAFGDMACHVIDPIYRALKLDAPVRIQGSSSPMNTQSAPQSEIVRFDFPGREAMEHVAMPPVSVHWYDGGLMPDRPEGMDDKDGLIRDGMGGCMLIGSKDTLICDTGGFNPRLLSGRTPDVTPYLRRIPGATGYIDGPHEQDWIRACKELPENRVEGSAHFSYSGPFNEMVLLGVLAIRLQGLEKALEWDAEKMTFTNIHPAEEFKVKQSEQFLMIDGVPRFMSEFVTLPARATAQEYIQHTYRDGWSLPKIGS